jgi:GNAT superfamily N-acetyltransferase
MPDSPSSSAAAIRIRPADIADLDTIVDFNKRLASETEDKLLRDAEIVPGVRRALTEPGICHYFVAEIDARVAGQAMVTFEWSDWRNGWLWWFQSVYVAEPYRRAGVFRALYAHIRQTAQAHPDVCGLRLYVEKDNRRAQATYASLGMHPSGHVVFEEDFR